MATIEAQAEFLRVSLLMGLTSTVDVDQWASKIVGQSERPSHQIVELATCATSEQFDVARMLAEVAGESELEKGAHMALAFLRKRMQHAGLTIDRACLMLYAYSQWARVSESESQSANALDDSLWLLKYGTYSEADVVREVEAFISAHADLEAEIPL